MRLVTDDQWGSAAWAVKRIPHVSTVEALGSFAAVGVEDKGELIAAAIFHNYHQEYGLCEVTFAASTPRFALRSVIRGLLSIPFEQYLCRRLSAIVPHDATRTARFVSGIGFVREGCCRELFGDGRHGVIFGMTRKDYEKLRRRIG